MSGVMSGGPGVQLSDLNIGSTYFRQVLVFPSVKWELPGSCDQ